MVNKTKIDLKTEWYFHKNFLICRDIVFRKIARHLEQVKMMRSVYQVFAII